MKYKGFTLDKFQISAVKAFEHDHSVVVSAPTGSGKTLIADYVIDYEIKKKKRVVYTAPIKALSNQKYKEFKALYGEKNVGIVTGDVVINPGAALVIMTTEIYRNMILVKDPLVEQVRYVIFDEIHFINDVDRGYVWEESIIFSPSHVRFLCLSATIPNSEEFAQWVQSIKKHPVDVVKHDHRPVPLKHLVFDVDLGVTNLKSIKKQMELDRFPQYNKGMRRPRWKSLVGTPQHWQLIKDLKRRALLPCIYFAFSRSACQKKAAELAKKNDFLLPGEREKIISYVHEYLKDHDKQIKELETMKLLRALLAKGIAFHHAGVLPQIKEIVEHLFGEGLIKVLYATETFAVGINMPAKVVCFDSLEKYDGHVFRYLNTKEYFQLAGRAGRRGIDTEGKAIALVDRKYADIGKIKRLCAKDIEPLISRFKLGYNTVLNMLHFHNAEEIEVILKSNFGFFQKYGIGGLDDPNAHAKIKSSFTKKRKQLIKMGYVTEDDKLTQKGFFASRIYANELLISEIFFEDLYKKLTDFEMVLMIASIVFESKRSTKIESKKISGYTSFVKKVSGYPFVHKKLNWEKSEKIGHFVHKWFHGCTFIELMELTNLLEGDIIRFFRQIIDVLTQIRKATPEKELRGRLNKCVDTINREFINFENSEGEIEEE